MIGVVLVTHGRLAEELFLALEHIVGPQIGIARVCVGSDDNLDALRSEVQQKLAEVDQGAGVIILTDMFGGTPSNLATAMMSSPDVEVISGVNLPMLVKLSKVREKCCLCDASEMVQSAGRKYIAAASHVLRSCRRS